MLKYCTLMIVDFNCLHIFSVGDIQYNSTCSIFHDCGF